MKFFTYIILIVYNSALLWHPSVPCSFNFILHNFHSAILNKFLFFTDHLYDVEGIVQKLHIDMPHICHNTIIGPPCQHLPHRHRWDGSGGQLQHIPGRPCQLRQSGVLPGGFCNTKDGGKQGHISFLFHQHNTMQNLHRSC